MFEQLILHAVGDYLIQNDWMALNKKKRSWKGELACQVHCITYSLPFLLVGSWWSVLAIYASHYLFDRTKIVDWFLATRNGVGHIRNFGFSDKRPFPVVFFVYVVVDNTFHVICNWLALYLL